MRITSDSILQGVSCLRDDRGGYEVLDDIAQRIYMYSIIYGEGYVAKRKQNVLTLKQCDKKTIYSCQLKDWKY